MGGVLQEKDACNIFLVSDRKLDHAFTEDMRAQGAFGRTEEQEEQKEGGKVAAEKEAVPEVTGEQVMGETLEQPGGGEMAGGRGERERGEGSQLPTCDDRGPEDSGWSSGGKTPPAGIATKNFVRETLPELQRLSNALKR